MITSVKFRMYDTGSVGDCLLLLFMKEDIIAYKMLIDCGGWDIDAASIRPVVEDIKATCNDELDLLVVTHQHKDHVSGFNYGRALFDSIKVKQVWMSWMENPKDAIAKKVKDAYGKKIKSTLAVVRKLKEKVANLSRRSIPATNISNKVRARARRTEDALDLLLFEEGEQYGRGAKKGANTNQDAMDYVRRKGKQPIQYWKPGEVAKVEGAEGVKFFMLGPPRDSNLKLFFTKTEVESEIYKLAASSGETIETLPDDNYFARVGTDLIRGVSPFSGQYQLSGKDLANWWKEYEQKDMQWRQVELDSAEAALGIALEANRYTNNTSFAMAIELPGGKVMLLPGDAQSGNWMSWHKPDVMKKLKENGGKNTEELLRDTVFYKIGHHCSKNGTASVSGLDLMNHPELVGIIPLIKKKVPKAWKPAGFPARPLYKKLIEHTKGRLIRLDEGVITDARAEKLRNELSAGDRKKFQKAYRKGSCWQEFTIEAG